MYMKRVIIKRDENYFHDLNCLVSMCPHWNLKPASKLSKICFRVLSKLLKFVIRPWTNLQLKPRMEVRWISLNLLMKQSFLCAINAFFNYIILVIKSEKLASTKLNVDIRTKDFCNLSEPNAAPLEMKHKNCILRFLKKKM